MKGIVNQEAAGGKGDFVTLNPDLLPAGPIRDAVAGLREAMLAGDNRLPERIEFSDQDMRVAHANTDFPRNALARAIKDAGGAEAAVLAVDTYFGGRADPRSLKNRKGWRKLAAAFYAQAGETSATLKTGRAVSIFAKEAVTLDDGSYGKYWSSTEEMAARGFPSWLEDKLASEDRRNDYLSVYADNQYHVDPLLGKLQELFLRHLQQLGGYPQAYRALGLGSDALQRLDFRRGQRQGLGFSLVLSL